MALELGTLCVILMVENARTAIAGWRCATSFCHYFHLHSLLLIQFPFLWLCLFLVPMDIPVCGTDIMEILFLLYNL